MQGLERCAELARGASLRSVKIVAEATFCFGIAAARRMLSVESCSNVHVVSQPAAAPPHAGSTSVR